MAEQFAQSYDRIFHTPAGPVAVMADIHIVDKGNSAEELIAFMRASGLSKPHSIGMLSRATGFPLGEAKDAVHFSSTWDDRRDEDDAFHQSVFRALDQLQQEDDRSPERLAS